jgi:hypothetical protein
MLLIFLLIIYTKYNVYQFYKIRDKIIYRTNLGVKEESVLEVET